MDFHRAIPCKMGYLKYIYVYLKPAIFIHRERLCPCRTVIIIKWKC